MNKLYKRAEFLRKFLEYHGLYWKVEIITSYYHTSSCKYIPMYKGSKICNIGLLIDRNNIKLNFASVDNAIDYAFELSINLLSNFKMYFNVNDPDQCNLVKYLRHCVKYIDPFKYDYENIDFEHLIECLILDGIPLDKFPSIEEVL